MDVIFALVHICCILGLYWLYLFEYYTPLSSIHLNNEKELLHLIADGDENSFNKLYNVYSDRVFTVAYKILQNQILAEDIVQDVFLTLWRYKRLNEIESVHAWLRTLTRNQALKVFRSQATETRITGKALLDWKEGTVETERQLDYRELKTILDNIVSALPEQQRRAYILCHVDGMSYQQAASEMGLSKLTVQSYMKIALKSIRERLAEHGDLLIILFALGILR